MARTAILVRNVRNLLIASTSLALVAIGAQAKVDYHGDTSGLSRQSSGHYHQLFVKSGFNAGEYQSIVISDVKIYYGASDELRDYPKSQINMLGDYFEKHLEKQLGKKFKVVNKAGPGTLRIKARITDATSNRLPLGHKDSARIGSGERFAIGMIAVEVDIIDATTGEKVWIMADRHRGRSFGSNGHMHTMWGDAKEGLRRWARQIQTDL